MSEWHRLSNVRPDERLADCGVCGPDSRIRRTRNRWSCGVARTGDKRTKAGVPSSVRAAILQNQDGRCAICGASDGVACLDHDHSTGALRGVLCRQCNLGLGYFKDDQAILEAAARYIAAHAPAART